MGSDCGGWSAGRPDAGLRVVVFGILCKWCALIAVNSAVVVIASPSIALPCFRPTFLLVAAFGLFFFQIGLAMCMEDDDSYCQRKRRDINYDQEKQKLEFLWFWSMSRGGGLEISKKQILFVLADVGLRFFVKLAAGWRWLSSTHLQQD